MDLSKSAAERDADAVELKKALANKDRNQNVPLSGVSSIVSYCLASILMTIVNKFVVSGANFSMNFLLLCMQSIVCVICVELVKRIGVISFRPFDWGDAKAWFPVSFLLVSVIYTGSKSLQFLNIPVYTIFKNLTIILIAYGEVIWFGGKVTVLTFVSFIFMVLSSVIAAWADVTDTLTTSIPDGWTYLNAGGFQAVKEAIHRFNAGYIWMMINCLTSAGYVLLMRKKIKATGFSDWDSMFYNNLLTVPVLAAFSLLFEDWSSTSLTLNFPQETRTYLLSAIVFSGAAAVGISYTTAWCVRVTSSTTYSMVGALNKLPVAASGMVFFGNAVTFGSVSAIAIGFFAGVLYALAKKIQKEAERRLQGEPMIPLSGR